jgi:hypothetical protein
LEDEVAGRDGAKLGRSVSIAAIVVAALAFYVLWQIVQVALGVALGVVIAVLFIAGLAYLGLRRVTG